MERNDAPGLTEFTVRVCDYCRAPIPKRRKDARFCSTSHRVMASRKRRRDREIHASLVTRGLTDQGLAELHERAAMRDTDDGYAGIYDGGVECEPEWAAQDARIREMITGDQDQRAARPQRLPGRSWERFRGVEDQGVAQERSDRYQAEQQAIRARLASSAGQPENRFNRATRGAVAARGAQSRALNRRPAPAVSRTPAPQAYVFSAPEPAPLPRPGAPRDEDLLRF